MEKMPETGPGRPLKFPYSQGAKFLQFPWKRTWQKGRSTRFLVYSIIISMILVRPIDKFGEPRPFSAYSSSTEENLWNKYVGTAYCRAKMYAGCVALLPPVDKFAPPIEGKSGGHH